MPALTPSVLLANQYEAFPGPTRSSPWPGRRAGPASVGQSWARQRQAGWVRAAPDRTGQGRAGSKSTGQDREAPRSVGRWSVPDRAEQGQIQKNSKGRVMNRSDAPTYVYPKFKHSTYFGHLISVVPYFQFILLFFFKLFFSNLACGAPAGPVQQYALGRPVVPLTGAPARRMVLLAGLWWP